MEKKLKVKDPAAVALGKKRHEKNPYPPEYYKRISDLGKEARAKYWEEKKRR